MHSTSWAFSTVSPSDIISLSCVLRIRFVVGLCEQRNDWLEQAHPRRELQGQGVRVPQPAQLLPPHAGRHGHVAVLFPER